MDNAVNKKDFLEYVKVQLSGKTNMFDIVKVQTLSGLPKEKILDIMKHYSHYSKRWNNKKIKNTINKKLDKAETLIKAAKILAKSINLLP